MRVIADKDKKQAKEELYIQVRDKEGRIIPDQLLLQLPDLPAGHTYEWLCDVLQRQRNSKCCSKNERLLFRIGYPEMSQYYFHHSREKLKSLGFEKLYSRGFQFKKSLEWWVYKNLSY